MLCCALLCCAVQWSCCALLWCAGLYWAVLYAVVLMLCFAVLRTGWQAVISLFAAPAPYLLDSCTTWAAADATKANQAAFLRVRPPAPTMRLTRLHPTLPALQGPAAPSPPPHNINTNTPLSCSRPLLTTYSLAACTHHHANDRPMFRQPRATWRASTGAVPCHLWSLVLLFSFPGG
jgi:hypothetical protein